MASDAACGVMIMDTIGFVPCRVSSPYWVHHVGHGFCLAHHPPRNGCLMDAIELGVNRKHKSI